MLLLKKLTFSIPFFLSFLSFTFFLSLFFQNPLLIFGFDPATLQQMILMITLLLLTGFFFILFAVFASNWRYIIPVCTVTCYAPLLFSFSLPFFVFVSGAILSFGISYANTSHILLHYIDFSPTKLFVPAMRITYTLLILAASVSFFFASSEMIAKKGFNIPSSLLDFGLRFIQTEQGNPPQQLPKFSSVQLEQLKQNPQLLQQYGLTPEMLDTLQTQQNQSPQEIIRSMVAKQLQDYIKPYLGYVPIILTIIFFITLQSSSALLALFFTPFTALTFYLLSKVKYITFTTENREIKKLVV